MVVKTSETHFMENLKVSNKMVFPKPCGFKFRYDNNNNNGKSCHYRNSLTLLLTYTN